MKKATFKTLSLIGLGIITSLSACKDDDEGTITPVVDNSNFLSSKVDALGTVDLGGFVIPSNFDLNTGSVLAPGKFSGQSRRLAQLQEIADSARNEPITWDLRAALENTNRDQFASTSAQGDSDIRTKVDELNYDNGNTDVADRFAELADSLTQSSQANFTVTAVEGVAGMITTGSKKRHVSANGLEYAQVLEKGLYGAMMYDQMVDDYLRPSQGGADGDNNETAAGADYTYEGTGRQHAFDEAFGYFGADPLTYPNTSNTSDGDGSFIANYVYDFSDELETAMGVNISEKLMDAFIFGRSVLKAGEGFGPTLETTNETYYEAARADIKLYTEAGLAAASYSYLNSAIDDLTDEDKIHHLSEALGFIYALSFNSEGRLTSTEAHNVLIELGWSTTDPSLSGMYQINLWDVTDTQMENAKNVLEQSFPGFNAISL